MTPLIILTLFSLCMLAIPVYLLRHLRRLETQAIEAYRMDKERGFELTMNPLLEDAIDGRKKGDSQ